MRVGHYAQGKFSPIECPKGSRVVAREQMIVPLEGKDVKIPAEPLP